MCPAGLSVAAKTDPLGAIHRGSPAYETITGRGAYYVGCRGVAAGQTGALLHLGAAVSTTDGGS